MGSMSGLRSESTRQMHLPLIYDQLRTSGWVALYELPQSKQSVSKEEWPQMFQRSNDEGVRDALIVWRDVRDFCPHGRLDIFNEMV